MDDKQRWPKGFYLGVGLGGLVLVGIACALNARDGVTLLQLVGALLCGVVILFWMLEGFTWHARREQRMREQQVAAARAQKIHREAQEAAQRVVTQVNARRTVSHGGMTINVQRTSSSAAEAGQAPQDKPGEPS